MASFKEQPSFCPHCQRSVLARREDVPHTFWLIASVFSCGLFVIPWIILTIINSSKSFLCPNCGSATGVNPMMYPAASGNGQFNNSNRVPTASKGLSTGAKVALGVFGFFVGVPVLMSIVAAFANPKIAEMNAPTNQTTLVSQTNPSESKTSQSENTPNYKAGFQKGTAAGRLWGKDSKITGMPMKLGLEIMSRNAADLHGKKDNAEWQNGWIAGFKKEFTSARGGKVQNAEDNPNFESLSWNNVAVGTKLYDSNEKHEATVVSTDESSGLIYVRYLRNNKEEPKLLNSVAQFWFVNKN